MARSKDATTTAQVEQLRTEIARWRRDKHTRARLPEGLWARATEVAGRLGPYGAAQDLGVSYDSLRRRLDEQGPPGVRRVDGGAGGEFLEVTGEQLLAARPKGVAGSVVEVRLPDGVRVLVRLGAAERIDVGGLVRSLRGAPE